MPVHKRFGALLWRERRPLFWAAMAAALLSFAAMLILRRKLLALLIAVLGGLAHGCQGMLDQLKELH